MEKIKNPESEVNYFCRNQTVISCFIRFLNIEFHRINYRYGIGGHKKKCFLKNKIRNHWFSNCFIDHPEIKHANTTQIITNHKQPQNNNPKITKKSHQHTVHPQKTSWIIFPKGPAVPPEKGFNPPKPPQSTPSKEVFGPLGIRFVWPLTQKP